MLWVCDLHPVGVAVLGGRADSGHLCPTVCFHPEKGKVLCQLPTGTSALGGELRGQPLDLFPSWPSNPRIFPVALQWAFLMLLTSLEAWLQLRALSPEADFGVTHACVPKLSYSYNRDKGRSHSSHKWEKGPEVK